ncbi:unnamed protein product [Allacma fusca]|uniref:Uncharacterized protein n=1 Tax=Allacma fusca TaxID=39272 RepID=A0A8J2L8U8_9HEXA|nr:unnamed protein product [Allacma fusca]
MTVSVGDRLLGIIRGAAFGICKCGGSLISVQNRNGESFFEIERKGSEYTFVRNGTTIATARKGVINGDDFGVEFSASLDTDTKAMIAAVSYNLYVLYHAETACGCSGTLALTRCFLLIPVITMLTVGIIIAIVVTTI